VALTSDAPTRLDDVVARADIVPEREARVASFYSVCTTQPVRLKLGTCMWLWK
jgi:hypothetical protein